MLSQVYVEFVLTSQAVQSFEKLLTQCTSGTKRRISATYIYLMLLLVGWLGAACQLSRRGNERFKTVDGSPGDGRSRCSLPQHLFSSFLLRASTLVVRLRFYRRSILLQEYLPKLFRAHFSINLVLKRGYRGQRNARRNVKRIKHTRCSAYLMSTCLFYVGKGGAMHSDGSERSFRGY
jgi:hypothetical protein